MRASAKTCGIAVTLMAVMSVAGGAQVSLQPGLYERVTEVDAAGDAGKSKDTLCWSPEDAKDVAKTLARSGKETGCKASDVKMSPGKLTFKVACKEGKKTTTTENNVTYGPDWYTNVSKGKAGGDKYSQKVTAKRIGECKN